ncbi:MAG: DUF655 domain-containing protein [archaeon]|nr:DUF655 domain-containing protein [archaeon]
MEDYVYVLDYFPQGSGLSKREPTCYAIGELEFKLFELVLKKDVTVNLEDRVYIGKNSNLRKEIDRVKRRIGYSSLTNTAIMTLEYVVRNIITQDQKRFIRFYNESQPVGQRKHMLEELPGLGKKMMSDILAARSSSIFKDFEDLRSRVPTVKDPIKLIVKRILQELSENNLRRYIFVVRNEHQ